MNTQSQHQRLNRRAAAVLYKAIDSLPLLLADSEPAQAAAIAADLVKFQLTIKEQEDPGAALAEVIRRIQHMGEDHDPPST